MQDGHEFEPRVRRRTPGNLQFDSEHKDELNQNTVWYWKSIQNATQNEKISVILAPSFGWLVVEQ